MKIFSFSQLEVWIIQRNVEINSCLKWIQSKTQIEVEMEWIGVKWRDILEYIVLNSMTVSFKNVSVMKTRVNSIWIDLCFWIFHSIIIISSSSSSFYSTLIHFIILFIYFHQRNSLILWLLLQQHFQLEQTLLSSQILLNQTQFSLQWR